MWKQELGDTPEAVSCKDVQDAPGIEERGKQGKQGKGRFRDTIEADRL